MTDGLHHLPLMHTPPPADQTITVNIRTLWQALNGFGFDDPDDEQTTAFETLWAQIRDERFDRANKTALHYRCFICRRDIPITTADSPAVQIRRHFDSTHPQP